MIPALNFSEEDWENLTQNWTAWWAGEFDRPLVMIESPVPKPFTEELTPYFLAHKPVDEILDYYEDPPGIHYLGWRCLAKVVPFFWCWRGGGFLRS